MPSNVLDLFVEFRHFTNGLEMPAGASLFGALTYFGIDNIGAGEKDNMRDLTSAAALGRPKTNRNSGLLRRRCPVLERLFRRCCHTLIYRGPSCAAVI